MRAQARIPADMRYAAFLALFLTPVYAQDAPEATTAAETEQADTPAPRALEEEARPYLELNELHVAILQELAKQLGDVQDRQAAIAAAPKVAALAPQVKAMHKRRGEILPEGEPDEELQEYLRERNAAIPWEGLLQSSVGRAFELLEHNPPCYGSNALQNALLNVLDLYLGEETE